MWIKDKKFEYYVNNDRKVIGIDIEPFFSSKTKTLYKYIDLFKEVQEFINEEFNDLKIIDIHFDQIKMEIGIHYLNNKVR